MKKLLRYPPRLSAVIVGTLALGIGAATALYSVIDAVLLRPYPFRDQERLAVLWQADVARNHPFVEISYLDARDWRSRAGGAFESIASMSSVNFATGVTGVGDPQQVQVRLVSDQFFDVLGTPPALGRTLRADDHRFEAPRVVVIGHGVWQRLYGGDPAVVGRVMVLDHESHTIVGVMPRGLTYPDGAELWAPVEGAVGQKALHNRNLFWMVAVGRLRQRVSVEQARAALDVAIQSLSREFRPKAPEPFRAVVRPLVGELLGTTRQALLLLLCAVGAVLLIACANVSNLLLSRGLDRRRDVATRIMLGASRGRLARHLLGEVAPLAAAGGILGVGVAWLALTSLASIAGAELPRGDDIAIDWRALAVAAALSIGAGLLCALAPLVQTREVTLGAALRDDARAGTSRLHRRLRDALVTAEIALALVLLVGASLLVTSFYALRGQDLGFKPDRVITAEIALSSPAYTSIDQIRTTQRQIVERLRAIPGVEAASGVYLRPLWSHVGNDATYVLEGQRTEDATDNPIANQEAALPGYFDTMGIRLIAGRDFTEHDNASSALVVIVSESLARSAWPNQDPIGRRLRFASGSLKAQWLTVVGVAADTRYREIEQSRFDLYQPYGQFNGLIRHFVVRSAVDPQTIAGDIRRVVREIDPNQPVELMTMDEIVATAMGRWRLNARLFGALAGLALLLAAVGTYSVMNYAVSGRTREIGVRLALGADRPAIAAMVLRDGLRLAAVGIGAGLLFAYAVSGVMAHLLVGVGPRNPVVFAGAALFLCLVALAACYVPARRAASVDPITAMRFE